MDSSQNNFGSGYVLISNIPPIYKSAHMRWFFSGLIEAQAFECFHYKHRPQFSDGKKQDVFCAFALVKESYMKKLMDDYNNERWLDKDGAMLDRICRIARVEEQIKADEFQVYFRQDEKDKDGLVKIKMLTELKPPNDIMPQGNVGTPLSHFLKLIREYRLPPPIIRKLDLNFPKSLRKRIYSNVGFNYGDTLKPGSSSYQPPPIAMPSSSSSARQKLPSEPKIVELDEEAPEDWERHEALHKDVTEQERTKQRLYEDSEELEVVWEKGGSGLVHYTDATYWDQEAGDFDEKTTDDWDVDMTYSDKDGQDWLTMKRERQRLKPNRDDGTFPTKQSANLIKEHKKRLKAIAKNPAKNSYARRIMAKHGWVEGQGLGKNNAGIKDPIENDVQVPGDYRGLGYRGEKLFK